MLFPMIESALPEEILRAWHRTQPETRNLSKLMLFLRQEVESAERIQLARRDYNDVSLVEPMPPTACFVTELKQDKDGRKNGSSCVWCDKDTHSAVECHKAAKMTLKERLEYIKSKKACSICLKSNHITKKCKSFPKCLFCQKRHFTIMCTELAAKNTNDTQEKQQEHSNLSCHTKSASSTTLLQTVVVKIVHDKKEMPIRALIDSGAQRSYITKDLVKKLGLKSTKKEVLTHSLFGGIETKKETCHVYDISVKNLDENFYMNLCVLDKDVICSFLPKLKCNVLLGQLRQRGIVLNDCTDSPDDICGVWKL
ncbi:uncharacterized protein [Choristoneura fumiferana]|uniref:uncharacterized protein n=1 Tax=Choristoneura fumiferana TaxID=7141 RepID=UPI003D155CB5